MPATPTQPIQTNLPWETYEAVVAAAKARDVSQSQWMREAVEAKLTLEVRRGGREKA